ncbi:MAG: cation-translocating P-type ATPase [Turicibacter sp.]|nr:cation-translocating P-type ATPase [Turicibacter sp.]
MRFYQMTSHDVLKKLRTKTHGLSLKEVTERQKQYGLNIFHEEKEVPFFQILLRQFEDRIILILIVASIGLIYLQQVTSLMILFTVVFLTIFLKTIQSLNSVKTLKSLSLLSRPRAKVIRQGRKQEISAIELTVGDILLLEAGDIVSVDARVIEAYNLQVNEKILTKEVGSVEKGVEPILTPNCPPDEQVNMVFSSSVVTKGSGVAVVTKIGMDTEIGQLVTLLNETSSRRNSVEQQLDGFKRFLVVGVLVLGMMIFGLSLIQDESLGNALMFTTTFAIAVVPEALVLIIMAILWIGKLRIEREKVKLKWLSGVESLASISVICSDKTGTLTQNKMIVRQLYLNNELLTPNQLQPNRQLDALLLLACGLCQDDKISDKKRMGYLTKLALVRLLEDYQLDEATLQARYPRLSTLPFDGKRKLMSTIHVMDKERVMFVKGAPEELLDRCNHVLMDDGVRPLSWIDREVYQEMNQEFFKQGLSVLAFAYKKVNKRKLILEDEDNLILLGFISFIDPPRYESEEAVFGCKQERIKPIMLTSDHTLTAQSIAEQIGIYEEGDTVLDGNELDELLDVELEEQLMNISVYANVNPSHKTRIIKAWQELGHVVAMTGDAMNDVLALKRADLGISMGLQGSELSKEAASMILEDDNFATIVKVVMIARNIYLNIKCVVVYLLSVTLANALCILFTAIFMLPLPLYPQHFLLMNVVIDPLVAIAIGIKKQISNSIIEKPCDFKASILDSQAVKDVIVAGILMALVTMIAYFIGREVNSNLAVTLSFMTLCVSRMGYSVTCMSQSVSFKTSLFRFFVIGVGSALISLILFLPSISALFMIQPLSHHQVEIACLLAMIVVIFNQVVRYFRI